MIRLARRVAIAAWALVNAERLLALHFDMLRESRLSKERQDTATRYRNPSGAAWNHGRGLIATRTVAALDDMPGADANRRAL